MKLLVAFLSLAVLSTVLAACSSSKKSAGTASPSSAKIIANFDYSPPVKTAIGSTGITISLIRPVFVRASTLHTVQPITDMASSMAGDFQELLTAKGFKFQGPFENIGAMTYPEQQKTSFCMAIEITLTPDLSERANFNPGFGSFSPPTYKTAGDITFSGKLDIVLSSPHSVRLLVKNISIDPETASYVGTLKWQYQRPTLTDELKQDNAVYNAVARALEKIYTRALALAWQQIDPDEMKEVAKSAKEADAK